ncbi:hypothetical protein ACFYO5_34700 [Streptomyces sp. NPDC006259]|uniref:hypothetical protein n=1 Tax=Streptomyces sp. NPDC006259 TaxID=3364740 RepID=UPI0036A96287
MKPVSEVVVSAARGRVARVRRLLWRGAGATGGPSAEMTTARAIGRAMFFTLLAVSLVGTLMTTIYLPAPWGRLVVLPAALGAFCAGVAACLYALLASCAVVEAAHRRASAAGSTVKRHAARRREARTSAVPK